MLDGTRRKCADATEFGLVSFVYTRDLSKALAVAERIESGIVGINRGIASDPSAPFGGWTKRYRLRRRARRAARVPRNKVHCRELVRGSAFDIIMPQLGETLLEGTISTWYKKPGEQIAANEPLFDVETDKVSTSIPSPVAGVVREILVDTGVTVKVGARLAVVESASDTTTDSGSRAGNDPRASALAEVRAPAAAVVSSSVDSPARVAHNTTKRLSPAVVRRLLAENGLEAGTGA